MSLYNKFIALANRLYALDAWMLLWGSTNSDNLPTHLDSKFAIFLNSGIMMHDNINIIPWLCIHTIAFPWISLSTSTCEYVQQSKILDAWLCRRSIGRMCSRCFIAHRVTHYKNKSIFRAILIQESLCVNEIKSQRNCIEITESISGSISYTRLPRFPQRFTAISVRHQ